MQKVLIGTIIFLTSSFINIPGPANQPFISSFSNGSFVVTWVNQSSQSLNSQLFNQTGSSQSEVTQLVTSPNLNNEFTLTTTLPNGELVLLYGLNTELYARIINSEGNTIFSDFEVTYNGTVVNNESVPNLCSWPNGEFVAFWLTTPEKGYNFEAQIFSGNTSVAGFMFGPMAHPDYNSVSISCIQNRNFIFSYTSNGSTYLGVTGSNGTYVEWQTQLNDPSVVSTNNLSSVVWFPNPNLPMTIWVADGIIGQMFNIETQSLQNKNLVLVPPEKIGGNVSSLSAISFPSGSMTLTWTNSNQESYFQTFFYENFWNGQQIYSGRLSSAVFFNNENGSFIFASLSSNGSNIEIQSFVTEGCNANNTCPSGFCTAPLGVCQQCESNTECNSTFPNCNDGICVQCYEPHLPCDDGLFCHSGVCVNCTTNADCAPTQSEEVCNIEAGLCVECLLNSDCGYYDSNATICHNSLCVQCLGNQECGQLACIGNTCQQCNTNSECTAPNVCGNGLCVECVTNSECNNEELPVCIQGVCGVCTNSSQCNSTQPYCSSTGACVECTQNEECSQGSCVNFACESESSFYILYLVLTIIIIGAIIGIALKKWKDSYRLENNSLRYGMMD